MSPESHALARVANGAIGALVGVYAFLDDLLLGPILVAVTVWVPWYLVFGVAACALTFINIACCNWMQRSWDEWIRGYGAKLEARLEKIRRGRLLHSHRRRRLSPRGEQADRPAPNLVRFRRVLGRLRRNLHGCRRCDQEPRADHLGHPPAPRRRVCDSAADSSSYGIGSPQSRACWGGAMPFGLSGVR